MNIFVMIFTMVYRALTSKCSYCGTKLFRGPFCPNNCCHTIDSFIHHKEANVQRALGLLLSSRSKWISIFDRLCLLWYVNGS